VIDQGIDTSTAVGRMFFQILGAIAEFEHALMATGPGGSGPSSDPSRLGPPRTCTTRDLADGWLAHTVSEIASEFGASRPTIYRHLRLPGR